MTRSAVRADASGVAAARLGGVHEDLQRAVQLHQITPEQAALFEAKIEREILRSGASEASET
ncbi:hypothetical protein [Sinomonas gamaensis]|uniref:hypothetical protein n=1 Tax=Sinomonas gamaensis TaxID=2565624 RepID=UPI00110881B6|nr:hypothetical protein [Sinomonas gamaensis]